MTVNEITQSSKLFTQAKQIFAGGVNSPVRAFKGVGGEPIFFKKGQGAHLFSVDGKQYIDYVLSWGPLLLGHAPKAVVDAISKAAACGTTFGAPHEREIELARLIQHFLPSCEMIRFVNSGTEATMSAIRLARGATGRKRILKFNGNYHGHSDPMLVQAGSGGLTLGIPDSQGVLAETASATSSIEFNNLETLQAFFCKHGPELAGVIVEPVSGNMGVVPGQADFLRLLRDLCSASGALLIFDEVMTGFRVHLGGAQSLYGITPDITCLGKVIGGGLPCGAYAGRSDLMRLIAPEGPIYQAGTLSGNPVVMAAGIATLGLLKDDPSLFERARGATARLAEGIRTIAKRHQYPIQVNAVGTMFTLFCCENEVRCLQDALKCDTKRFSRLYHELLNHGIYCAPSQFEANFLSCEHGDEEIQITLHAFEQAIHKE